MRAAYEMVKAKVINADSDLIGVIFFGAVRHGCSSENTASTLTYLCSHTQEHTKNDSDFKGVYEYLPLDNPSATAVKALEVSRTPNGIVDCWLLELVLTIVALPFGTTPGSARSRDL